MASEKKNILGTLFTLMMLMASTLGQIALFAIPMLAIAPAAQAANGLGEVTFFSLGGFEADPITSGVLTVNANKDLVFKIHNDQPVGTNCIDEIIITFPNTWQGVINPADVTVTNLNDYIVTNESDDGTFSGLVNNGKSVRIIPNGATDGVMLCPSGTTQITIPASAGLSAPAAPELSTIMIMTSDEDHNEVSSSFVRQPISVLPQVAITEAEEVAVKYLDFTNIVTGTAPASYTFTAQAKGGWGRLTELYLNASAGMTVDVYVEKSGAGLQIGTDYKIASGDVLAAGVINTVSLSYTGVEDVSGQMTDGYIKDAEQGGVVRPFYIVITAGAGTLEYRGHTDENAAEDIDPTYSGTDYTNPPKEGTVINVENVMKRKILVQLVETDPTNSSRKLNVKDDNIQLYYSTTLSGFQESTPTGLNTATRLTDADGQAEIRLNPGTEAGNALVEICFPDPACTTEDVAISPGAPVSCEITEGLDVAVQAGSLVTIEATIYDQYGNVIANSHYNNAIPPSIVADTPLVTFDMRPPAGLSPAPDADLDDDILPPFTGDGDQFESEPAQFGIADASLQTSSTIGTHIVEVKAGSLVCGNTTITGTLGQAGSCELKILGLQDSEVSADGCFDVLVNVEDANGNPLPKWESIVEISLEQLDFVNGSSKFIQSTDLREEKFLNEQHTAVQGKLNPNDPAHATITVCGCEALGTFDVACKTDTLNEDRETLDTVNSAAQCIDVTSKTHELCGYSDDVTIETSVLDTCGNKLIDQECSEGGFASSCVRLETTCGTLSTDKTCVDLKNTGMAPNVQLDTSACACGDIVVTAVDEADCCPSVIPNQPLPTCEPLVINKIGPAVNITMEVYPKADNQDNFWVSEKEVVELTLLDACGQVVTCEQRETVDVTLKGEDCVDTSIQVNSPLELVEVPDTADECAVRNPVPLHKIVFENCADGSKEAGNKEWTDLPEKDDLVIDKIAFEYNGNTTNVQVCIYEETEAEAGFQSSGPNADLLWKCSDLTDAVAVPSPDGDNTPDNVAWDSIHDESSSIAPDGVGDVYIIELDDRISKFNGINEYDNQRLGGAIVEPGDTKDFYLTIDNIGDVCGTYDIDYLYFEDYNSPDITGFLYGGHVLDTLEDSEEYTRRNDDYTGSDPYPVTSGSTPSYGFGDTELHDLLFSAGKAFVYFRDLVAETVSINVDADLPVSFIGYAPAVAANQANVTFLTQPATQVVARNHGDLGGDAFICDDVGFEPTYVYDPDQGEYVCDQNGDFVRDCRPAMACSDEEYDINLQVADGFQNQVGLETEVQLLYCLEFPHFLYLGDTLLPIDENITIDLWEFMGLHDTINPRDVCFDSAKFKGAVVDILDDVLEGQEDGELLKSFVGSEEFDDFVSSIFDDKQVQFYDENGVLITQTDAAGHLFITTDSDGKARIKVRSEDSSQFQIKSFDTSFRLFFVPHALDADYFDVAFAPGNPAQWDVLAIPSTGIPADGEQEAKLLIRKLDACGNAVAVDEAAKVSVSGSALISRDFSGNNNYDNEVEGDLSAWSCKFLFPWFEDCSLQVSDTVLEDVVVTVDDAVCEEGTTSGLCVPNPDLPPGQGSLLCETHPSEETCRQTEACIWVEADVCDDQESDATLVKFVGAPVKLKITEIKHSDLIPADGWTRGDLEDGIDFLPQDACTEHQFRECTLNGEPEICFKNCVQYGNTGGWVTVEVQDKFGQRVTGYLGDGFKGDPGDKKGTPDNVFEKICVALDDPNAFIDDSTFGWINLDPVDDDEGFDNARVYCGDLAYGRGSFHVVYSMLTERFTGDGEREYQPLDPRETEKVIVSVFDVCDRDLFEKYYGNWKEEEWDDLCNGQEYNENNLPDSEVASRLTPDENKMIFVSPADRWDITANKVVAAADGQDYVVLEINTENAYMDVRTSLDATVQSSLLGSKIESEAITPGCYVKGIFDPVNPTSINVMTEACSGGRAKLKLSSTEEGIARVTVTGNNFGCVEFEVADSDLEDVYAVPKCEQFGVIPMTPKTIEVEFKQAYQNQIVLKQGWNFFSVPKNLAPSNDNWNELGLNTLCSASATWNEGTQSWQFSLGLSNPVVEPLQGYWCNANSDATISVTPAVQGSVFLPPTKAVFPGWNDVGLSTYVEMRVEHALISIDGVYSQVLDWVESLQRYSVVANTGEAGGGAAPGTTGTADMEAGQGYFIWSTGSDTLAGLS